MRRDFDFYENDDKARVSDDFSSSPLLPLPLLLSLSVSFFSTRSLSISPAVSCVSRSGFCVKSVSEWGGGRRVALTESGPQLFREWE